MRKSKMLEKMKPIIAEQLNVNEAEIKPETKFKDDLGADSLDLFEMVMALGMLLHQNCGNWLECHTEV